MPCLTLLIQYLLHPFGTQPNAVETVPSASWPDMGQVAFRKVTCRYQSHLPLVLTGLSFQAEGGTSVGLVGRTGCGKSTSLLCLFRILEVNTGSIFIDGVDIATVPLSRLRSQLSIM
jgi:ATP-binding cassette subfamily C (CFTR/MRP) protein 1